MLRNKLLWVALVCAAPVVLGTVAYLFGWSPGAPANYGELIPPRVIAPLSELRGKWVIVTFDAAACDAYCERKLYIARQVRRAQGKDMERIERMWVITDAGKPRADVLAATEGTRISRNEAIKSGFPGNTVDHIYLVDPLGNLMMRFPRDPDPSQVIKDLQRLLKYSRFG
jgi:cytochrome oxidase Cu insertion factor (SCO1/SenC/PrrC family)